MGNGVLALIELRIAFIGLVCLIAGVALCLYTLRLWREARPESPALAPLEVMSDDEFVHGSDQERRELMQMARAIAQGETVAQPRSREARPPRRPTPQRRSPASHERVEDSPRAPIDPLLK